MINYRVIVDTELIDEIDRAATRAPKLVLGAYRKRTLSLRRRILADLRKVPGAVVYADNGRLRWKSDRQRRKVIKKLRDEGNLPYQRTGEYVQGYDVEILSFGTVGGGIFAITHPSPTARFIGGDDAQPFHLDTGWVQTADVVVQYDEIAENELFETWVTLTDPRAGVR